MYPQIHLERIHGFMDLLNNGSNEKNILKLNKVVCKTKNNQEYKVIRYDKDNLNTHLISTYGLCRSIIVNSQNQVVSFSPPKSFSGEDFMKTYPSKNENIIAMEFVEGTMINVFWDSSIGVYGAWEISTRNTVGAVSSFYKDNDSTMTFRDMFLEAANDNNLVIELLNKKNCYSFVLQHPKNRIVVPFKKPQLYLVGCYTITNNVESIVVEQHSILNMMTNYDWSQTTIRFPEIYSWDTYTDLIEKYASMNTPYSIMGVVLYNQETGERTKFRNPVYEQVRSLRGNQPKLQYQYLCLRKEGKVGDFLNYYSENKKYFSEFRDQVHCFTNTLYSNYVSCYIKKEKPLNEFPDQYRTHMFHIHRLFLTELKEKKQHVSNTVVIKYVNEMHPSLLMYCLNHPMRKRYVDFVKNEVEII
jgi:hypothetical protein